MSRIEWSRYSGDEIEAVVAMFISAIFPSAERITPSKGDGGIDVLVKTDRTRVYQVKRFSGPLNASQVKQVKKSVDRLVNDPRVSDLTIDEWHLVMPWDPTLEAKKWLTEYVTGKGLPEPIWDGLTKCDLWASTYPNIVDYYLGGNAQRIQDAALAIVHAARLKDIDDDDIEKFNVANFTNELEETVRFLNREDPFYSYGVHVEPVVGPPTPEDAQAALERVKPGVVLSTTRSNGQVSVQVDVYPRNAVATELNPIFGKLTFSAEKGSPEERALRDFVKFGSPLDLPLGTVGGSLQAPGGLGGDFEKGAIRLIPNSTGNDVGQDLRMILYDGDGNQSDVMILNRRHTSSGFPTEEGVSGLEAKLVDESRILEILLRFDAETQGQTAEFTVNRPDGRLATEVLASLEAHQHMRAPYTLTLAPRFGPIPPYRQDLPEIDPEPDSPLLWYQVAKSLCLIQEHTPLALHVPDLTNTDDDVIQTIISTGALLNGKSGVREANWVRTEHRADTNPDATTIGFVVPWEIELAEGRVDLGNLACFFSGAMSERAKEEPDGLFDVWTVTDGKLMFRMLTSEEQAALQATK
ncbi:hypothetical protein AB0O52_10605 [Arthrobacter sp. NPDC080073]|uniref:hypothetical protein n=1 Tax=Arthrobacter sp. NPDC080073 TaxID=3155919 RepID=UPI0034363306